MKSPAIAGAKPGMDATKGALPKQPFAKKPITKKSMGGRKIGRGR